MTAPPCAGQHALFDSTDRADHHRAAALCATCPILTACRARLTAARSDALATTYGPRGTWAGELVGADGRKHWRTARDRIRDEDDRYSERDARDAHAAWTAGTRGEWERIGERVYQRRRKRRARRAA